MQRDLRCDWWPDCALAPFWMIEGAGGSALACDDHLHEVRAELRPASFVPISTLCVHQLQELARLEEIVWGMEGGEHGS